MLAEDMREHAPGVSKAMSISGAVALQGAPRDDSLRTRPGYWRRSVREVARFAAWIVVDTREGSPFVDAEIIWLMQGEYLRKVLFVIGDDGEQDALDNLRAAGIDPIARGARVVTLTAMDAEIFALRDAYAN
ncbi:hypothetical protein [Variovorax sp. J22R115]|uniref:hypothetical protein n=1 Tax=Variovorax sp. J22R115 TaxID=3053509 RepID=UPI0025781970|nr:hypothetical protein [Variovorax sp. J22R115]MDM0050606.1 hypothetical protein [Variovorax sp. J22R115]